MINKRHNLKGLIEIIRRKMATNEKYKLINVGLGSLGLLLQVVLVAQVLLKSLVLGNKRFFLQILRSCVFITS